MPRVLGQPPSQTLPLQSDQDIVEEIDLCLRSLPGENGKYGSGYFRGLVVQAGGARLWDDVPTEFYNPDGMFTLRAVEQVLYGLVVLNDMDVPRIYSVPFESTLFVIFSQLNLEEHIYDTLMDCRELAGREELSRDVHYLAEEMKKTQG
jgi:hypothetical protein